MYVYRGKHTIAAEEAAQRAATGEKSKPGRKALCGTPSGYNKHHRDKTPTCDPCREAHRKDMQDRRRAKGIQPPRLAKHGTISAYRRHHRHGEKPCEPCRKAWNAHNREYQYSTQELADKHREYHREYMRKYRAYLKERSAA
ncbi:hypothetical protein ACLMMA_14495 [Micrococcus luteus]